MREGRDATKIGEKGRERGGRLYGIFVELELRNYNYNSYYGRGA